MTVVRKLVVRLLIVCFAGFTAADEAGEPSSETRIASTLPRSAPIIPPGLDDMLEP